jgi:hypothetical protein
MNPIPESFDVKSLIDCKVEMVCFNANQIYIHVTPHYSLLPLNPSFSIVIQSAYSIERNNKKINYNINSQIPIKKDDSNFLSLVEEKIEDAYTDPFRKDLSIKFSNGMLLTLLFNPMYESYEIIVNKHRIIM